MKPIIYEAPHYVFFSTLPSNILLSFLLSNTLNICTYLGVRDQVQHPCKTAGKIMIFLCLNIVFIEVTGRQETMKRMVATIPHILRALNLFVNAIYI
jgi:hypothetical protein